MPGRAGRSPGARGLVAIAAASIALATLAGCRRPTPDAGAADPPAADPLARLRAFEGERRAATRFVDTPVGDRATGPDPYALAALDDGRVAGILRGRDALVVLDRELTETLRAATPRAPSAIAVYRGRPAGDLLPGDVLVTSELEPVIARYRIHGGSIERLADVGLGGDVLAHGDALGVRDITTGPEGVLYVVEEHDDRLVTVRFEAGRLAYDERRVPAGPLRLRRTRDAVFVLSLLAHRIVAHSVDRRGLPTDATSAVAIDGPYWGFDATDTTDGALLVAGGVEDHPLDRTQGFFGYVDSFVYVYRWNKDSGFHRSAAIDVAEQGLIVPKAIAFRPRRSGVPPAALVTSYGAPSAVRLEWSSEADAPPTVTALAAPPGASALVPLGREPEASLFVAASPLLDAWVRIEDDERTARVVRAEGGTKDGGTKDGGPHELERLGEALFFTGLMAPSSSSEGAKSRFSCETCHFEGYVDGRTHHTGRGDVRATTKPLVGLFNNRPHFSRALDPDLSAVAENEFRVAGAPSPADPHFELDTRDVPWLAELGIPSRRYDATELRLALMSFLMTWTHRTNPRGAMVRSLSDEQRRGALAFRERCERCHQARASADDPASRIPFEEWERLLVGGRSPLVWASDAYEKTGVEPYVHERGARVPSLRRLYKKRPYFTNGSAATVLDVLRSARFRGDAFAHAQPGAEAPAGDEGEKLDETTIAAIAAFLELL